MPRRMTFCCASLALVCLAAAWIGHAATPDHTEAAVVQPATATRQSTPPTPDAREATSVDHQRRASAATADPTQPRVATHPAASAHHATTDRHAAHDCAGCGDHGGATHTAKAQGEDAGAAVATHPVLTLDRIPADTDLAGDVAELTDVGRQTFAATLRRERIPMADAGSIRVTPGGSMLYACHALAVGADALPAQEAPTPTDGTALVDSNIDVADTFKLHSLPGASGVIHLDADGHVTENTTWNIYYNDGDPIVADPWVTTSSSDSQKRKLIQIWRRVAEDFAAYDIDVTTEDPGADWFSSNNGVRVVITPTDWYRAATGQRVGGVAFYNTWTYRSDRPVWAFTGNLAGSPKYIAEASSHESGHALNLAHDGKGNTEYYGGHGSGETRWAPIMGNSYGANCSQWCKGEYSNATNTEDDLAEIINLAGLRSDDHADSRGSATPLDGTGTDRSGDGFVATRDDVDWFRFSGGGDSVRIAVDPAAYGPNLDVALSLYDQGGSLVATANQTGELDAIMTESLADGTWYLAVEGTGQGTVDTGYSDYASIGYYSVAISGLDGGTPPPPPPSGSAIGEAGTLAFRQNSGSEWQTVAFAEAFDDPIVVATLATFAGSQPSTVRVRNVSATGFEVQIDEWEYLDGGHITETVTWVAVERGAHTLDDGSTLIAGSATVGDGDTAVAFATGVPGQPVVMAQAVGTADPRCVTVRLSAIDGGGFTARLQSQEADGQVHGEEAVHYLAIAEGIASCGGADVEALRSADAVTEQWYDLAFAGDHSDPVVLAGMQTLDGRDTAAVRLDGLAATGVRCFVEEEQSGDSELNHTTERVGAMVFKRGLLEPSATTSDLIAEAGSVDFDQSDGGAWQTVAFAESFADPVVVASLASFNGGQPSAVRVRNVTSTGFEVQIDEWEYLDGYHVTETVTWVAVERGTHVLDGGGVVVAGSATVADTDTAVDLGDTLPAQGVVVAQAVTTADATCVTVRLDAVSTTGFTARLQSQEASGKQHRPEEVHYLALSAGIDTIDGGTVEAIRSADSMDHKWRDLAFAGRHAAPVVVTSMQTLDGSDTAAVRLRDVTDTGLRCLIEEEQSGDSEVRHTSERVGVQLWPSGLIRRAPLSNG